MKTVLLLIIPIMVLGGLPLQAGRPPPIKRVEIRDAQIFVNGKPFFPIGIDHAAHWHYSLPEAGEKGFNTTTTHGLRGIPESFRYDIDEAYANGMYAVPLLTNSVWENLETVEQIILACRDAPGLLVWGLEHQPDLRLAGPTEDTPHADRPYRMPPESFKAAYAMLKRLDPAHPVQIELAYGYQRDYQRYSIVTDIHNSLVRPVPANPLTLVARFADRMRTGAPDKLGWLVLQMMAVGDRHPTMAQVRCMTYMAVTHDISGVFYKAFHYGDWWVTDYPGYWAQWADLTDELHLMTPYLTAPAATGEFRSEIVEGNKAAGPFGYGALHQSLRQTADGYFLIAVNGIDSPIKARFTVPVPESGLAPQATARLENRLVAVNDGVIEDAFLPYEVHLYELFKVSKIDRETIDWPRWQRRARP